MYTVDNPPAPPGPSPFHLRVWRRNGAHSPVRLSPTSKDSPGLRYPLRRNQSSIAGCSRSSGTRVPASITPSPTGSVSSKIASLVKFRMAKLSIHRTGHAWRAPSESTRSIENLRMNISSTPHNHRNAGHSSNEESNSSNTALRAAWFLSVMAWIFCISARITGGIISR